MAQCDSPLIWGSFIFHAQHYNPICLMTALKFSNLKKITKNNLSSEMKHRFHASLGSLLRVLNLKVTLEPWLLQPSHHSFSLFVTGSCLLFNLVDIFQNKAWQLNVPSNLFPNTRGKQLTYLSCFTC